ATSSTSSGARAGRRSPPRMTPGGLGRRTGPSAGVRAHRSGGTVAADEPLLVGELAAVVDQEAAHAGELVLLARHHLDRQLFVREVGSWQFEGLGRLGLVLVDVAGVLVMPTRLELFDALFGLVFLVLARCVVIGGHASVFSFPILRRWYP